MPGCSARIRPLILKKKGPMKNKTDVVTQGSFSLWGPQSSTEARKQHGVPDATSLTASQKTQPFTNGAYWSSASFGRPLIANTNSSKEMSEKT